jgi:hypothetical protein
MLQSKWHLPNNTNVEIMGFSFEVLQPCGFSNSSAERKQSFGYLKSPDAYEGTNAMIIE